MLQPSSASSVGRSVVRRRLRVMLTITTLDERATHRPISTAAVGVRPAAKAASAPMAVVSSVCSGAATKRPRCSRLIRITSISMPTSKRSRMTPMSAITRSSSRWATNPGVNGDTATPTAR